MRKCEYLGKKNGENVKFLTLNYDCHLMKESSEVLWTSV